MKQIVITAGGTGGHIFPAEALATFLTKKGCKIFFITDKSSRRFQSLPKEVQVLHLPFHKNRSGLWNKLKFFTLLAYACFHAWRGLKFIKPSLVIGFGGYPSFPTIFAAKWLKIPYILHEQNSVLGRVNRFFAKKAYVVATAFDNLLKVPKMVNVIKVGNPVRQDFYMYRETGYEAPEENDRINILVTGGSQGAQVFSKVLPAAVELLSKNIKERLYIIHQCPTKDVSELRNAYDQRHIHANVVDFIDDMAEKMTRAHLVICRAGASAIAELQVIGRPAILIPYPYAMDDHQYFNAENIEKKRAGWLVREAILTPEYLFARIDSLIKNPSLLEDGAANMKSLADVKTLENIYTLIQNFEQERA